MDTVSHEQARYYLIRLHFLWRCLQWAHSPWPYSPRPYSPWPYLPWPYLPGARASARPPAGGRRALSAAARAHATLLHLREPHPLRLQRAALGPPVRACARRPAVPLHLLGRGARHACVLTVAIPTHRRAP
eukprot:scaffold59739_cov71-Phaeocystis_antarctica.AAC.8